MINSLKVLKTEYIHTVELFKFLYKIMISTNRNMQLYLYMSNWKLFFLYKTKIDIQKRCRIGLGNAAFLQCDYFYWFLGGHFSNEFLMFELNDFKFSTKSFCYSGPSSSFILGDQKNKNAMEFYRCNRSRFANEFLIWW